MVPPLEQQLRHALGRRTTSLRAIARAADVDPSALSRFLRGERNLSLATADRLAGVLGVPPAPAAAGAAQKG